MVRRSGRRRGDEEIVTEQVVRVEAPVNVHCPQSRPGPQVRPPTFFNGSMARSNMADA